MSPSRKIRLFNLALNIALALAPILSGADEIRQVDKLKPQADPKTMIAAAKGVISRTTPSLENFFQLEIIPPPSSGCDVFEIETVDDKVVLRGNTGVALCSAYYRYLTQFCRCHDLWCGTQLRLPSPLPKPSEKLRVETLFRYRVYFNYCTLNYTASWWNWKRWQREIDLMAMHGINMPLAITGLEAVWYHTLLKYNFTDEEARKYLVGPCYFAWQWMTNIQSQGGPLPKNWIDRSVVLGKKILESEKALGMIPIMQGFSGCVPQAMRQKFPKADITLKHQWCGFRGNMRTAQLDPLDPLFPKLYKSLLETQKELFGTTHLYAADPFHEGTPPKPGNKYLADVGKAIYKNMIANDPDGVWAMQAWSIREKIACAVPKGRLLVLDLGGGRSKDANSFWGHSFIKGQLHNFGGRINMHGDLADIAENPFAAVAKKTDHCLGMGLFMEGIEQNPVFYELVFDQIWRDGPENLKDWLADYAKRRYGAKSAAAVEAWNLMVTDGPYVRGTTGTEASSIIAARPALHPKKSGPNRGFWMPYKPESLIKSWHLLLQDYNKLKTSDAYQFDLMDITRQVLSNLGQEVQKESAAAYETGDMARFEKAKSDFLMMLADVDTLLNTRQEYNFWRWYSDAISAAKTPEEKKLYSWNASMLLTIWGPAPDPAIFDYAWREWSGLIKSFYLQRWKMFYDYITERAKAGQPYVDSTNCSFGRQWFRANEFYKKLADFEINWIHQEHKIPKFPQGDTGTIAKQLAAKYAPLINHYYSQEHYTYLNKAKTSAFGMKIATVTPSEFKTPMTFDITKALSAEGDYQVSLEAVNNGALPKTHSVTILANGETLATVKKKNRQFSWRFHLTNYAFGTKYLLKCAFSTKRITPKNIRFEVRIKQVE